MKLFLKLFVELSILPCEICKLAKSHGTFFFAIDEKMWFIMMFVAPLLILLWMVLVGLLLSLMIALE